MIPHPAGLRRVGLAHRELGDRLSVSRQCDLHPRPAAFFHPRPAPGHQILRGPAVQHGDQLSPACVAIGMGREVLAQAVAQCRFPDQPLQMGEDDRRLLINDGPVEGAGFVQVVERLSDGIGPGGAVDAVRRRMVREQKAQLVVDLREGGVDDLRRHEVGERLLHPDIVEPGHRHQVTEPLVGRLVCDDTGPPEIRILGGALVEQQRVGAVEHRARMLHAAVLEGRHQHEVELLERERNAGVLLQPRQGRRMQIEDGAGVALDPLAIGLAVVHRHPPPVALGFLHLELARRKGEEIAADRVRLAERQERPIALVLTRRERPVGHRPPPAGTSSCNRNRAFRFG